MALKKKKDKSPACWQVVQGFWISGEPSPPPEGLGRHPASSSRPSESTPHLKDLETVPLHLPTPAGG